MTNGAPDPDHDHPEAMTLALHEASPPHMVDAMVDDVVLELGWGRLIFGQTFADPENRTRVGVLMDVPDMDALMAAMETQAAADAMEHDGVLPETLVILVES